MNNVSVEKIVLERVVGIFHQLLEIKFRTQASLARSLGIPPQKLSKILKGKLNPQIEEIAMLISTHRINPYYIFEGKGPMFQQEGSGLIGKEVIHSKLRNELLALEECKERIENLINTL